MLILHQNHDVHTDDDVNAVTVIQDGGTKNHPEHLAGILQFS